MNKPISYVSLVMAEVVFELGDLILSFKLTHILLVLGT